MLIFITKTKGFDYIRVSQIIFCKTYRSHSCSLVAQLCPTLCNPMDCSPPGSSVRGVSQARILAQVAISFSRGSFWPRNQTHICCIAGRFFTAEPPGKPMGSIRHFFKKWPGAAQQGKLPTTPRVQSHRARQPRKGSDKLYLPNTWQHFSNEFDRETLFSGFTY